MTIHAQVLQAAISAITCVARLRSEATARGRDALLPRVAR